MTPLIMLIPLAEPLQGINKGFSEYDVELSLLSTKNKNPQYIAGPIS